MVIGDNRNFRGNAQIKLIFYIFSINLYVADRDIRHFSIGIKLANLCQKWLDKPTCILVYKYKNRPTLPYKGGQSCQHRKPLI